MLPTLPTFPSTKPVGQAKVLSIIPPVSPTRKARPTWKVIGLQGPKRFSQKKPKKHVAKPRVQAGFPSYLPIPNARPSASPPSSAGIRTPSPRADRTHTFAHPIFDLESGSSFHQLPWMQTPTKIVKKRWAEDIDELGDDELPAKRSRF